MPATTATVTVNQLHEKTGAICDQALEHPVVIIRGNQLLRLERYEPVFPEYESPELEAELLQAVRGPHAPLTNADLAYVRGAAGK